MATIEIVVPDDELGEVVGAAERVWGNAARQRTAGYDSLEREAKLGALVAAMLRVATRNGRAQRAAEVAKRDVVEPVIEGGKGTPKNGGAGGGGGSLEVVSVVAPLGGTVTG
jgi:hypothetical protein